MDNIDFRKALDIMVLEGLLRRTSCPENPWIRLESGLVYLWDIPDWIPLSVEDVDSITVFQYVNLARFSLKDIEGYMYIPLRNSGLSLKDLQDYFGKKLLVEEASLT